MNAIPDEAETSGTAKSSAIKTKTATDKAEPASKLTGVDRQNSVVAWKPPKQDPSPFRFVDIASSCGVDFVHFSGMTKDKHFPTANGSGCAVFDYDGDGLMDLYFATATCFPLGSMSSGPNRLYRNLGNGKFADVTESSGLGYRGFCHGIVIGDIDNDGDQDVFLANYGSNVLYENRGDGTFREIGKSAGIERPIGRAAGRFSITTTTAISTCTSRIMGVGIIPRMPSSSAATPKPGFAFTALRPRFRRFRTCSTATTATRLSRRSRKRSAYPVPETREAEGSAWLPSTSTATTSLISMLRTT